MWEVILKLEKCLSHFYTDGYLRGDRLAKKREELHE